MIGKFLPYYPSRKNFISDLAFLKTRPSPASFYLFSFFSNTNLIEKTMIGPTEIRTRTTWPLDHDDGPLRISVCWP